MPKSAPIPGTRRTSIHPSTRGVSEWLDEWKEYTTLETLGPVRSKPNHRGTCCRPAPKLWHRHLTDSNRNAPTRGCCKLEGGSGRGLRPVRGKGRLLRRRLRG